jgi:anti-sigma factor RsiW
MKCSDMKKEISRELDGELEQPRAEALAAHLETCEDCRDYRASMQQLYFLHSGLVEVEAPFLLLPSVMSALEESARRDRSSWWLRLAVPAMVALVLFLGVLVGGRLAEMVGPVNGNGQADVFGLEYLEELPPGSIGELMLADSEGGNGDER